MNNNDSVTLLEAWRDGDNSAAAALFHRYVERLIDLARSRLSPRMQRRVDAEDVVQSAYRSFFAKAGDGRYTLEGSGNLWPLLSAITLSKVRKQVELNTAQKRNVASEASFGELRFSPEMAARDPEPADVLCAVEELERLMTSITPVQRRILEMRLQEYSVEEVGRSERTVRRVLARLREELDGRLNEVSAA